MCYSLRFSIYIYRECMTYMALLIFYAQVIRGDRLDRLDAFYLCHCKTVQTEPVTS